MKEKAQCCKDVHEKESEWMEIEALITGGLLWVGQNKKLKGM